MLTKVILEGPMGKQFGREWELNINSPHEALRMIDANKPGVFGWIRNNLEKYSRYRVICTYQDGTEAHLSDEEYKLERKCTSIRFVPVIEGAGGNGIFQTILGIVLIVVGVVFEMPNLVYMGAAMAIGGVAAMLAPKPKLGDLGAGTERKDKTSYYFDGPANTTVQGVPVQLIYGRCMVGSHAISAALTVDQLM